jgi:alpha-L-rhamnosidase
LEKELPKVYGMISSGDKENGNLTLGQLPHLFYLGIDPKAAKPVLDKIFSMVVW